MGSATDALALVKDAKKFEAKLHELARCERGAEAAIEAANQKANEIIAEADVIKRESEALLAKARACMAAVTRQEESNLMVSAAAQEVTDQANQHEKRLQKGKEKLAHDRALLNADKEVFKDEQFSFMERLTAFDKAVEHAHKVGMG